MGKISLPLKNSAYLPTRSFSYSSGSFCCIFHGDGDGDGFSGCDFCPGGIGLPDSEGRDGQFEPIRLVK